MRNKWRVMFCAGFMAIGMMGSTLAQDGHNLQTAEPKALAPRDEWHFYHLEFVVKEVEEGKVLNSRNYSTSISTEQGHNTIRAGSKVPIPVGTSGGSQFRYEDVGVNIDCNRAQEIGGKLVLHIVAEVSSINISEAMPVVHQFRWETDAMIAPGKPTTILSSDDVSSKRKMEVELKATRIQ